MNMSKNPEVIKPIDFISALEKIGKSFNENLKKYSGSDLFSEIFPELQAFLGGVPVETTANEVEDTAEVAVVNDTKDTTSEQTISFGVEESLRNKGNKISYDRIDNVAKTFDEMKKIMFDKLEEFTFAACANPNNEYILYFSFNNKEAEYEFTWNKEILHFDGETNHEDSGLDCHSFYFDEVQREFIVREYPEAVSPCENCDEDCGDCWDGGVTDCCCDECCDEDCGQIPESNLGADMSRKESPVQKFTAQSLFKQINDERKQMLEEELFPAIKNGIDKIFAKKQYSVASSETSSKLNIIIFTLESVRENCDRLICEFWNEIPYSEMVKFLVNTYDFPKVLIFEKTVGDSVYHEVRCFLKEK